MTETTPTIDRAQVVESVLAALTAVLDRELPGATEDTRLNDVGLDSTGVLELLLALEDAVEVEFDTDELEMGHFQTVRSLTDFVCAEMGA